MRVHPVRFVLAALMVAVAALPGQAQDVNVKDKEAIAKNADGFVAAFHKGDAKGIAAFWAPEGDYTDLTGRHLQGRDAIQKAFTQLFADNKGLKVRIESESLRFVTPEVAIEDGMTAVIPTDGGPPTRAKYSIVHVKKEGKWLLGSVRDTPYSPPTQYPHLRELEWLVGDWADANDKGAVARAAYSWAKDQNFLLMTFTTTFKNISIGGGTQWIGYDAAAKQIRSWTFELNGGFGAGTWTKDGKKWTIKTVATTADGTKVTLTTVLTPTDADTYTLQVKGLTVGDRSLPDSEIKMKRVK